MRRQQLVDLILQRRSYLCIGLDTDRALLPASLRSDPDAVLRFNRDIIDATRDDCVAYKINTAFYESQGRKGWEVMEKTASYIGSEHFLIADAKRGDIGNTSSQYAIAFLRDMPFDAITVAPYMGEDSVRPFMGIEGKWVIVLGLTSNTGSRDFQQLKLENGRSLYQEVILKVSGWGNPGNTMFVIGATQASEFKAVRSISPDHFYLVPGVGAQGGSLKEISEKAMNAEVGLLVNASRAIIYASGESDFAEAAGRKAGEYREEMSGYLERISKK